MKNPLNLEFLRLLNPKRHLERLPSRITRSFRFVAGHFFVPTAPHLRVLLFFPSTAVFDVPPAALSPPPLSSFSSRGKSTLPGFNPYDCECTRSPERPLVTPRRFFFPETVRVLVCLYDLLFCFPVGEASYPRAYSRVLSFSSSSPLRSPPPFR